VRGLYCLTGLLWWSRNHNYRWSNRRLATTSNPSEWFSFLSHVRNNMRGVREKHLMHGSRIPSTAGKYIYIFFSWHRDASWAWKIAHLMLGSTEGMKLPRHITSIARLAKNENLLFKGCWHNPDCSAIISEQVRAATSTPSLRHI
jgi:hypothetical protein